MAFDALPFGARPDLAAAMRRDWSRLARSGTWWSGEERTAIAAVARAAQSGNETSPTELSAAAVAATQRLAVAPASTTREMVAGQPQDGLDHPHYVELAGVVSRLAAIDAFHRALGIQLAPLPPPRPGEPTLEPPPRQPAPGRGFVPMVGGASIVGALSLAPEEMAAQRDLHGPLYLSYEDMGQFDYQGGLHRTQMELVAARTSALNECFY